MHEVPKALVLSLCFVFASQCLAESQTPTTPEAPKCGSSERVGTMSVEVALDALECLVITSGSGNDDQTPLRGIDFIRFAQEHGNGAQQISASYTGARLGDPESESVLRVWARSGNSEAAYRLAVVLISQGETKEQEEVVALLEQATLAGYLGASGRLLWYLGEKFPSSAREIRWKACLSEVTTEVISVTVCRAILEARETHEN